MKCGTRSLHSYLDLHPQIHMSSIKELNYFLTNENCSQGLEWYSAQFSEHGCARGESSPNYSRCHRFPNVPERMHAALPDIKLIYLLRNPVDRAVSHYVHEVSRDRELRSISDAFERLDGNNYMDTGRYMFQLQRFLKYYRDDQIHIVFSEDLLAQPTTTMQGVFRFLGVDSSFCSDGFEEIHHKSSDKTGDWRLVRTIRRMRGLASVARRLKLRKILGPIIRTTIDPPILSDQMRRRLMDYYMSEIDALKRYVGKKVPGW